MFAGNQKAWLAALGVLATGLVSQVFGLGEGPTDAQVNDFVAVSGEIVTALIGAGVTYAVVWAKTNVDDLGRVMRFEG